ncbi:MAG: PAS domain S-box protein [Rhodospirillaceae bacterium]|jgi:PAS domain S-box-containing protein|nr:PAS domain S-box protein [Rhodospirillaceae bacterium]MBT6510000.1 PAS domain S-box protein [Rhodospirillaceae bacterium]MBT7615626.1 PAS domain S-box protein [Rhodospirillaceae bacterium]
MATPRSELKAQPQVADLFGAALGRCEHGVILLNADGDIVFWNNWIAEASGVPVQAALGQRLEQVFEKPLPKRLLQAIDAALRLRQAATLSRALNPRLLPLERTLNEAGTGEKIEHQATIKPLEARGGRFCLIELMDVTNSVHREQFLKSQAAEMGDLAEELARNEQHLRSLLNTSPVGAAIIDGGGIVRYANHRLAEIVLGDQQELVGMAANGLFIEPDDFLKQIAEPIDTVEVRFRRRDGTRLWAQVTAEVTSFERAPAVLCWVFDISEHKATELALTSERDRATEQARARTEFLAMVSHEIRTPLNGIMGTLRMLWESTLDNQQRDYVETIQYSGDSLLAILNDVLDLSKLEAGRIDLANQDVDLHRLVRNLVAVMAARAEEKAVGLSVEMDKNVPRAVKTDPGRLREVLLNLIGNAIKFTEHGDIKIQVTQVDQTDVTVRLRFAVKDTGIGIAAKAQEQLFTEFYQVDSAEARRRGGTGLGLAICKRIVEAMGGNIGVNSDVGHGSTFWFGITLSRSTKSEIERQSARPAAYPKVSPRHILLVEDNEINQKVA